jgi:hypothetical protein
VADCKAFLGISTPAGDNFVDNGHLTRQSACNDAIFLKVPIQQADSAANKIKDLRAHRYRPDSRRKKIATFSFC